MTQLAALFTWRSAISESDLPPTCRHVALALSLYMNERGGSAHPGATRLANDTGLHISTVRASLSRLSDDGWLALVARGGLRGSRRVANAYEARVPPTPLPLVVDDPSPEPTRRPDRADPSSSPRRPLAQDDPNSSRTHQELSRGARPRKRGPQPTSEQRLASQTYVDAYASRHRGQPPPSQWRQLAARSLNALLDDGYDPTDVVAVAFALGNEGKKPTAAAHLLADRLKEPA